MSKTEKVFLPSDEELLSKEMKTYFAICIAVWRTAGSRRDVPGHLVDRLYELEDRILNADGTPFEFNDLDIDTLYGDPSARWVDELSAFCAKEPKQRTRESNLRRYQLIWPVAFFDTH